MKYVIVQPSCNKAFSKPVMEYKTIKPSRSKAFLKACLQLALALIQTDFIQPSRSEPFL